MMQQKSLFFKNYMNYEGFILKEVLTNFILIIFKHHLKCCDWVDAYEAYIRCDYVSSRHFQLTCAGVN